MAKTETELLDYVKNYSKGINEISSKLQSKSLSQRHKKSLENRIKQLVCFRSKNLQLLMYLREQKKVIHYAKFCMAIISKGGEELFLENTKNGKHPVIASKFQELFPDSEMYNIKTAR